MAETLKITHPFSKTKAKAEYDWYESCMRRHPLSNKRINALVKYGNSYIKTQNEITNTAKYLFRKFPL